MEKNKKGIWIWELGIRAFALLVVTIFSSYTVSKSL